MDKIKKYLPLVATSLITGIVFSVIIYSTMDKEGKYAYSFVSILVASIIVSFFLCAGIFASRRKI
jgi:hypothetical protein